MKVSELDFYLPPKLLARKPREIDGQSRSDSRMLVIFKDNGQINHSFVKNIGDYLEEGDLIVLNNSKTMNAVFKGRSIDGAFLEIALCSQIKPKTWLASVSTPNVEKYLNVEFKVSDELHFIVRSKSKKINNFYVVDFVYDGELYELSVKYGRPIISNYTERQWDLKYYQNEFATIAGSVEMPAAGRHFTNELLSSLKRKGINIAYITLHTGLSSLTIEEENIEDHVMYEEYYSISKETADLINSTKMRGKKVIAIGTTVTRTLESAVDVNNRVQSKTDWTDLYIYPGYQFKIVDGILTNFHGPRTSRIALAAAFTKPEYLMNAYQEAIAEGYLFYEFGDATLII
ncbi:S-adenosylmethionine:tRNA ribosyltransferase-isomerase (plasmid) [Geobacillus thermodenitrificans]|uniref:tRNA preQ1(34) S-adenosylmethionine ribosyltransferase-isomerase QueA n=1 Tax=Geobacillus thermodenitrificans TaxID=33940 RepID=UPI000A293577|nr:tRNA preQ1(34) S-adenosylmethionine ribosyltransferase-isomerase QueA [Geobacillus thermodenitrificans]ARP44567.1 S-adenosylmethionine:tRNA ribosyltransferase-isomerase [Geobacillus thermodenitrificans]